MALNNWLIIHLKKKNYGKRKKKEANISNANLE